MSKESDDYCNKRNLKKQAWERSAAEELKKKTTELGEYRPRIGRK
jgi:hypothetical protein